MKNTEPRYNDPYTGGWYHRKTFRKNLKKNWNFYCDNCRQKVSSAVDFDYYVGYYNLIDEEGMISNRGCTEECLLIAMKKSYDSMIQLHKIKNDPNHVFVMPVVIQLTNAQYQKLISEVGGDNQSEIGQYLMELFLKEIR